MQFGDFDALKHFVNYEMNTDRMYETEERRDSCYAFRDELFKYIDNAETVIPEELKPLIDKVVDILPELTDAIIEQLPQIISSKIKCLECSYYKDTWGPKMDGKGADHDN